MPRLNVTINVSGQPARRVYVEHLVGFIVMVPINVYMTDDNGLVRDTAGNLGIDSFTPAADIRILGQNSVARILDGRVPWPFSQIKKDIRVTNHETIDLTSDDQYHKHFRILNLVVQNYDDVHRLLPPFASRPDSEFPLGRLATLAVTKDQAARIEIVFPDGLPQPLAFCEPKSLTTGYPLIHIKRNSQDGRLFGTGGQRPSLIPSELSHALHFSQLTAGGRDRVTTDYLRWILSSLFMGGMGTHSLNRRTSTEVAFIEAMDHFSSRFAEFLRLHGPDRPNFHSDFINAELGGPGPYWLSQQPAESQVAERNAGVVRPSSRTFTGGDCEGAIYGAIFVDFASRTSLATAVDAYYRSQALTFGEYRTWITRAFPHLTTEINQVAATWGL